MVGAVVGDVSLVGVTTTLPAFAFGSLTKARWLGDNSLVGSFWIDAA